MGKSIVYCVACGRSLREDDFLKRRAQMAENRPWCADCRPISQDLPPVPRSRISTSKIPVPTPRRPTAAPPRPSGNAAAWWAGAGVVALLAVVVVVVSRPAPAPAPSTGRTADPRTERAVADLERFAPTASPAAVLARCAALRETVRGTPLERRVQAVEDAARRREEAGAAPPAVDAVERHLGQIRELIAADARYRRRGEVLNMIQAARASAGPRAGEFDRLEAEYERRFLEDRRRAVDAAAAEARRRLAAKQFAEATAALDGVPEVFRAGAPELEALRAEIARASIPEELALRPADARLSGERIFRSGSGDEQAIEGIFEGSRVAWAVDLPAGTYRVALESSCAQFNGGRFVLKAGSSVLEAQSPITGDWKVYQVNAIGRLTLPGGPVELTLDVLETKGGLMNLRSIRLRPD